MPSIEYVQSVDQIDSIGMTFIDVSPAGWLSEVKTLPDNVKDSWSISCAWETAENNDDRSRIAAIDALILTLMFRRPKI